MKVTVRGSNPFDVPATGTIKRSRSPKERGFRFMKVTVRGSNPFDVPATGTIKRSRSLRGGAFDL